MPRHIKNLEFRARVIAAIRHFFSLDGFIEVETPVRVPAPAPEPHINALPSDGWFLQTSPELYMKRLLAGGHERIFQVCRCFRQAERGQRHLPEFTLLEWYAAGWDYTRLMEQCEEMIRFICREVLGEEKFLYNGKEISIKPGWPRIGVADAFLRFAKKDVKDALADGSYDEVMAFDIEPALVAPSFLCDYPLAKAALARLSATKSGVAERFELYIGGLELCNGFSELTDVAEQTRRFKDELIRREAAGEPVYPLPDKFLSALELMPDAAGCALGVDRLVMLLYGADRIDDVVAFVPEEY
ncbi:MAG: EF-P lysine aminoacylase GenX [Deltaproteobacteria bacterium]|nr:EF-P lysine aminoacylase GenX [Deltaproteobacteria bacterium]